MFKQLSAHENVRVAAQMRASRYQLLTPRAKMRALIDRAHELLARVGLAHLADRPAADLAHGQQRALEVAMALAAEPVLLLMDEPTAGMAPRERADLMRLVASLVEARLRTGLSQASFAVLMGVSVRTLQDWEQGRREPSGAAKTLIKVATRHPEVLQELAL